MDSVKKYKEMWGKSDTTYEVEPTSTHDFEEPPVAVNPRKKYPMYSGLLTYFPNALKYVSHVSYVANNQHHPDKPLHWDKNKSTDEPDALMRHLADHSVEPMDDDGLYHLGKVCWRSLAMLERFLEENELV
jgi:hypothetical protein